MFIFDAMSFHLPNALPTVISPMKICLLRLFAYDDSPTIIANLTKPSRQTGSRQIVAVGKPL